MAHYADINATIRDEDEKNVSNNLVGTFNCANHGM